MQIFEKLGWEIKFPVILSLVSFFLSLIAGIVSGNPAGVVFFRAILFAVIFGVAAAAGLYVLKKYVPEIYDVIFSNLPSKETIEADISPETPQSGVVEGEYLQAGTESSEYSGDAEEAKPAFVPSGLDSITSSDGTSMGKHVLEEKGLKYQPKIMAEAIRTMMSKDTE